MEEKNNATETLFENNSSADQNTQTTEQTDQEIYFPPKRTFSVSESIYAWLCVFFGYAFCRIVPAYVNPLAAFLLVSALFVITFIIVKLNSGKMTVNAVFAAASAILINLSIILCSNKAIHTVALMYAVLAFTYFVYSAFENNIDGKFSNFVLADIFKSSLVMPFASFGKMFSAMFASTNKNVSKTIWKVFLGLITAIIPTVIVTSLLSFDQDFTNLIKSIFSFNLSNSFGHFFSLVFGLPIGMYIYGIFISSADKKCSSISKESCEQTSQNIKFLPCVTACSAVMPIFLVYILYFISQFKYFCSAFTNVLPENFSYAEYARAGFFQLLAVTVINALIILVLILFSKRNSLLENVSLKVVTILFSVATLILICSALSKMIMYINCYGLTPKRIYTSWFMVMLALVVIAIIIKQIIGKFKLIQTATVICIIMVAALSLARVDAFIAKYNVDQYIQNNLPSIDIELLDSLSEDSVEQMVRLKEHIELQPEGKYTQLYKDLNIKLITKANELDLEDQNILKFSLPRQKAKKALEKAGYLK